MPSVPLLQSDIPGVPCRRGKVRDVYDLGDRLVIVATDRLSAFDWVLPTGIPDKGRVLTGTDAVLARPSRRAQPSAQHGCRPRCGADFAAHADVLDGRTMLVRKADVVPIRVRGPRLPGRLRAGRSISADGTVCGIALAGRARAECEPLPEPIFTPATKEESGHDINISFERMAEAASARTSPRQPAPAQSRHVPPSAAVRPPAGGIIIADTKFEWGRLPDRRDDPDRRGADAGQLAVLAGGHVSAGHESAVVRQAICARLAGDVRLGQEQPAAGAARRTWCSGRGRSTCEAYERLTGEPLLAA